MCGIGGVVSCAGVRPEPLASMARALEHRGPDGTAFLLYEPGGELQVQERLPAPRPDGRLPFSVGLVHTRLAILDLTSAAAQPMVGAGGRLALSFNGEI